MGWSCSACNHLDKSKKEMHQGNYCYRYGCNARPNGLLPFWCITDNDLKNGGCSDFEEKERAEQISMFE